MGILHKKENLERRYNAGKSYSIWRLNIVKTVLIIFALSFVVVIGGSIYLSTLHGSAINVKKAIDSSLGNEVYIKDFEYEDENTKSLIKADKAYTYTENTDLRNLEKATITREEEQDQLKANNIKIESEKGNYEATGNAKYKNEEGFNLSADKITYDKNTELMEAEGNIKIVIEDK
ncbi:MAG: hypothetical protein ACPG8V_02515 [Alphaproteobacteria bacterium]